MMLQNRQFIGLCINGRIRHMMQHPRFVYVGFDEAMPVV
jgi:hypothetical protein